MGRLIELQAQYHDDQARHYAALAVHNESSHQPAAVDAAREQKFVAEAHRKCAELIRAGRIARGSGIEL